VVVCDDCGEALTSDEAPLVRLKRGERLCDGCWGARFKQGRLPIYYSALDAMREIVDALIAGLSRKET
jgi:hypothetical protein